MGNSNFAGMMPRWLKATIGAIVLGLAHYATHALTGFLHLEAGLTVMVVTAAVVIAYFALRMLL